MAVNIVKQLECTVPGTVHSLRLDTFTTHMRVDIILSRDRLGGSGGGVQGAAWAGAEHGATRCRAQYAPAEGVVVRDRAPPTDVERRE